MVYSHTPGSAQEYQEVLQLLDSNDESVTALDLLELQRELQQQQQQQHAIRILTPESLGRALLQSTTVNMLKLDVWILLYDELNNFQDEEQVLEHFASLIEYFRTSTALHDLNLRKVNYESPNLPVAIRGQLLGQIGEAVAFNPNIGSFGCDITGLDVSLPAHVLRMAPHVTTLNLDLDEHFDDQEQSMIADAFRANQSLTCLTMCCDERSETVVNRVLQLLPWANFHLDDLLLCAHGDPPTVAHFSALEQLLMATVSGNQAICVITLLGYDFIWSEAVNRLFSALFASSCEEIGFGYCALDAKTTLDFVNFIQGIEKIETNPSRSLYIGPKMEFEGEAFSDVLLEGLLGSRLDWLDVNDEAPLELLDGLLTKRSEIALATLNLAGVSVLGADALACFLPHAQPRLCSLRVRTLADGADQPQLVLAIHQNGSLNDVTIPGINPLYGPLLESVCQRNACLPQLLNQQVVEDTQHVDDDDDTPTPVLNVRRLPTLFTSARDGQQTAHNNVLIGLLSTNRAGAASSGLFPKPTQVCLILTGRENLRMLHRHWTLCNEIEKQLRHLELDGQCPVTRFAEIEPPHDYHVDSEAASAQVMDWYQQVVVQNRQLEDEIARQVRWCDELDRSNAKLDETVRIAHF